MENYDVLQSSLTNEQANAQRGLLKEVYARIENRFDLDKHIEMLKGTRPASVHKNLWEHAKLNMNYGLFRVNGAKDNESPISGSRFSVKPGDVFQVRGNDLANMTLVFDGTGWIVMDVLTTGEVAQTVWEKIVQKYLNTAKITAVIYSHTHVDHYGGVGGLKEKNFLASNCKIYAPKGFTEYAVSENIYVGTAMNRRGMYQYGTNLEAGVEGHVDCGLGTLIAKGANSIIKPDVLVSDTENTKAVFKYKDGNATKELTLKFQYTPGTEAPAEMNVYIDESKVLFIAENCCGTLHNLLTPRGAQVRDPLAWANYLDQTLMMFPDVETLCSSHNWPRFGKEECTRYLELQMDMYRFINNATLHLVNRGYTINEVGRMLEKEVPQKIKDDWCCLGFYGTYNHNAKAVYQKYIGWYDGNPSHLNQHTPSERANRYIDAFGERKILANAESGLNKFNDYAWAVEMYDYLLNADEGKVSSSTLTKAKDGYVKALQKLGYTSEAATWRNMYLTAAQEVANGFSLDGLPQRFLQFANETIEAMSFEMILQYFSIMLNFKKSADEGAHKTLLLTINLDNEEFALVWHRNCVLHYQIVSSNEFSKHTDSSLFDVTCSKQTFFRAYIELDANLIDSVTIGRPQYKPSVYFLNTFTRFRIDFPIMTPRPAMD